MAKAKKPKSKSKPAPKKPTSKAKPTKPKPAPKPAAAPKPATLTVSATPTLAELTAAYRHLLAVGTFESMSEGQAFFYAACWSDDAEIERVFEAWADAADNPENVPMDLLEDEFVNAGRFEELYKFVTMLDAPMLTRAVPMMRSFLAKPKRGRRYEGTQE